MHRYLGQLGSSSEIFAGASPAGVAQLSFSPDGSQLVSADCAGLHVMIVYDWAHETTFLSSTGSMVLDASFRSSPYRYLRRVNNILSAAVL